jgi:hypothetical protein
VRKNTLLLCTHVALAILASQTAQAAPTTDGNGKGQPPEGDNPPPAGQAPGPAAPGLTAKDTVLVDMVTGALAYALEKGLTQQEDRSIWSGRAKVTLYFLPNGRPISPLPTDLSEHDEIDVFMILPRTLAGAGSLNVTSCPDKVPYRVDGDFASAKKLIVNVAQGVLPTSAFTTQPLGKIDCGAGQVSLRVATVDNQDSTKELSGTTSTLVLGSVLWGTVGVQFAFDFTHSGTLSAATSPSGSVIVRSTDLLGPKVSPTFIWHPVGLDPQHAAIGSILLNPTLGFDLDAITTSFFVGDSLCWNGLCFCAGAHIRKTDELTAASGLKVGDPSPGTDPLPVEHRWSSSDGGVGFFASVILDLNTAAKIIGGSK